MDMNELLRLRVEVLWAAFAASAAFGAIAQRTHFCTMGAISDVVNMGDWTRLRMWAAAVGVACIGFGLLAWAGWIDPAQTLYASARVSWLSALLGGGMFGLGMVLASGCGSKTLVRIGAGSLKSLVVFVVMGVAAFATLRGLTGVWRAQWLDVHSFETGSSATLALWLAASTGASVGTLALTLGLVVGLALLVWALASREFRRVDPLLAGLGIGLVVTAAWWISGVQGFVPEHPETLEAVYVGSTSGRIEALSFTAPMAYVLDWLLFYSDQSKVLTLGVVSVLGVVAGSLLVALLSRQFHWEGFQGTRDTALHLIGGALMGVGGITAMGCTVGQGLSGLSTLSLGSLIAVTGIGLGAVLGFRVQLWLLDRD